MKSQLMRVVKAGAGAIMLSLCSGCLESDAESEVPAVSALPPVSAVSQVTAPTVQEAPKGPDTVPVLPAVTPEGAAAQPVNGPAGATSPGSTNDFKMVQPVRPPENLKASPVVQEVIKLAEAGVGDEVMMAYVTNSVRAYQLSSDEILYLTDLGVSTEVITAMLQKNGTTETTAPAPAAPPLAMNPATNPGPPAGPANQLPPALTEMPPDQAATAVAQPPQQPVATTTFYSSLAPYRQLGGSAGVRHGVAAYRRGGESKLEALRGSRPLDVDGLRLVLVFGLFVGLGSLSLWPVVHSPTAGLGMGAGYHVGSILGELAVYQQSLWMGAAAAAGSLPQRVSFQLLQQLRGSLF